MCRILIFGGTTEGRLLAEYCHERGIGAYVSVVSGYGTELLPENGAIRVVSGRLTEEGMEDFIRENAVRTVFDATHPYAAEATKNIKEACGRAGIPYLRVEREPAEIETAGGLVYVHTVEEAVRYLCGSEGPILVTTGSKELAAFTAVPDYESRVYARVLPSCEAISVCERLGMKKGHIIAMQGPFSEEMNRAMMNQLGIRFLVTKEAGRAGGFSEKLAAAASLGVTPVVIGRPEAGREGITVETAMKMLEEMGKGRKSVPARRNIALIGTGMGGPGQMTVAAAKAAGNADVLFGAKRMIESPEVLGAKAADALCVPVYGSREILGWLELHPEYERAGVLYSGDTGFYSGASSMAALLSEEPYCSMYEFTVYPGISSPSYLCARLGRSWEHVKLVSLHGREGNVADAWLEAWREAEEEAAVFVLLGGRCTVKEVCEQLLECGISDVKVTVGERLSYPEERIVTGTLTQCAAMEFSSLAVMMIERAQAGRSEGLPEACTERGDFA